MFKVSKEKCLDQLLLFPGQPIFLHAVNVQMLVRQFGSFEFCPKVIRGKILEKDSTSMTAGESTFERSLALCLRAFVGYLDIFTVRLPRL